jgi:pSer/pThr/pTyr-binding forkhead associated (FHA) protein
MTAINPLDSSTGKEVTFEEKTMVLTSHTEKPFGPRLAYSMPCGESKIVLLNKPKLVIGRSIESDLNLLDPLVSRKHCVIEKRDEGFIVRNVSTTNPLFLNDQAIVQKRIYAGDQIKVGSVSLAFISDRPEDARMADRDLIKRDKRAGKRLGLAVLLLFTFAGYFGYTNLYTPWKIQRRLESVAKQIQAQNYRPAQQTLEQLLNTNPSPEQSHQALELLARSVLAITQQKVQNENMNAAMTYLTTLLADYGANKEFEILWDRLDYFRLIQGQQLEAGKEYQPALRQFASIREDSIHFEEAQKAMRRIWLAHQQQPRHDQTMAQLLKEADAHFQAQRYLNPVNQNAYAVYQAVLALEPENELARTRIDQMKAFYRENGEKNFAVQSWAKALSYFERYYLIDTEDPELNEKLKICREKLTEFRMSALQSQPAPATLKKNQKTKTGRLSDEKKEEIRRLLEEAGTESSWIMKYLFEDQVDGKDPESEKPW